MKNFEKTVSTALVMCALFAAITTLPACQKQEGPAEHAGKEVDKAVEKAGEQVEKAGEKIQDAAKGENK